MSYSSEFSEKELIKDLLMCEKQVTSYYNTGISESTSTGFRDSLNACLNNVQSCQFELLDAMSQRGWNPIKEAPPSDVESAKRKFSKLFNELS
ncbi:spore coat protein [Wukongibacter baidiensis]|uniref:spore coat protein n=1 Tax=Wukongibacter baidiensis TaxID=1723361 RepID=UPI003D7FE519